MLNVIVRERDAVAIPFADDIFDLIVSNLEVCVASSVTSSTARLSHVQELLARHGFAVERVVKREGVMRFASGTALLNHHFIKLGFLDAWKSVIVDTEERNAVFTKLLRRLDDLGRVRGEVRLSVPMAYVEAVAC
jgi:hypothetical protein